MLKTSAVGVASLMTFGFIQIRRNRWELVRTHRWAWVRTIYKNMAIYHFAWKLDRVYKKLPAPIDATKVFTGGAELLDDILANGPDTYQKKASNRLQIESLMDCVCSLVSDVRQTGAKPLVLDIGAGKALFTRAVYEALDREVSVVALDSRRPKNKQHKTGDRFYDPVCVKGGDMPYTRVVADVRYLAAKTLLPLRESKNGGTVAITKHLCGGATDGSIIALCKEPLETYVGACCFAPCCHQKIRKDQYCNIRYLESMGFCQTHIGLRGGVQDNDFGTFSKLISISKAAELRDWEYKKSTILELLGFARSAQLGRQARRLLEEGRIRYLQDHGFDAYLVRYCDESVTGDNLAIIAKKKGEAL